jgi:hypothetical protein
LAASSAVGRSGTAVTSRAAAVAEGRSQAGVSLSTAASSISGNLFGSSGSGSTGRGGGVGRVARAGTTSSAVPVLLGVTKAVTDSNSLVSELSEGGEHVLGQVHGSLLVDIVTNFEPLVAGGGTAGDVAQENILGVLDEGGAVVFIIILFIVLAIEPFQEIKEVHTVSRLKYVTW